MARKKKYMCLTECQIFVEIDGKTYPKRYKFGEPIEAHESPNSHFIQVDERDYEASPREIMERILDDLEIGYQDDWTDDTLQRVYLSYLHSKKKENNLESLKREAKEIGAKYHHKWKDPQKFRDAIEAREIELSSN